ncbi:alpha/beta-hydrolase [Eremomyces bilateralis CBS 781.70]|uniref:Alpha/beta-hydrolase n=1 Tax=Eremomyces bilateralis CBS 781.70 TaxID=1392243 RepID=A0A6G1FYA5_9PEZI|nr:alpha/beta-hydrolase [Eremomyces bilateralis CBS 781.70]KAF1810783.1 alpha/beta-hydrolase [Eremomyces bilateralis CBS 781.70]
MGEHCVTDRPTPIGEVPTGEMASLGSIDCYISKPSDYPHSPSKLLLFLTGGTGIKSTNNQLQADKYASEGFVVVMPDQFEGNPAPNSATDSVDDASPIIEKLKHGAADVVKSFRIDMWLAYHTPQRVLPVLHKVLESAHEEFADAVANGGGVYGVGYCFGAKYILLLAGEHKETLGWGKTEVDEERGITTTGPMIKAGAVAHGTLVEKEDVAGVKVPMCLICVENDSLFPDEVRRRGVEALEKAEVEHEVKVYPKVPHGFAVYGDYEDPAIKQAQDVAFGQMLGWLQGH